MNTPDPLDNFLATLDVGALLQSKALPPLSPADNDRLDEIEKLTTAGWTEAEVRADVIDPIVRILGYRKGELFSVDREKAIEFRDAKRFIDYAATIWSQNFWLIEAKRPAARLDGFSQRDLDQALGYATHPEINAAIVIVTDGDLWEVFDRETDVAKPLLRFRRPTLRDNFDNLRRVVGPWQAWFLEKRRILRLVDRVFDHEVNLGRVDEFRGLLDNRLQAKRGTILDNFRAHISSDASLAARKAHLQQCDAATLIDVHLFQPMSLGDLRTISDRLVSLSEKGGFRVLHRLLKDLPRDANDHYWAHALWMLIALEEADVQPKWLPSWLGVGQSGVPLSSAIEKLISLCLTYFAASPGHRAVLLWAASAKRQFKILAHTTPQPEDQARSLHALNRHMRDELSFEQIVTSTEGQLLNEVSRRAHVATANFVAGCRDDRDRFRPLYAEEQVRAMWDQELGLLSSRPNYMAIVRDRDLGDLSTVEAAAIVWDELAHATLCVIAESPRWSAHLLVRHQAIVADLAAQGYWSARKLSGMTDEATRVAPAPEWIAERFFFGDEATAGRLAKAYDGSGAV
ncbi:type I restriction enzyme HsdR N-terminal domain-containing protein [Brevundimonas pondensis]|uniref:Type I restriction enzyme HsdR N-terminal domain-containing protein n=1 Tax=Brevundimonas pondensis TaxID=2774189 RepID=A0ABX7SL56_9CAUL|nr:type I restriction enzyme HsdR N-terminal domain-containing protein [Brevundimonas pondensis]QTC88417.1 type I restriction enzyme HsdR N-terminal domain-containing protein [Brevundimonas pondensis]